MIDLFFKGGFMMYPILLCSVVAFGITLERLIYITIASKRNESFVQKAGGVGNGSERIANLKKLARQIHSPISAILEAAIDSRELPREKRDTIVWRVGSAQRRDLEKYVNTLGVIGHIAPLMGLLGTVIGMIRAFMTIQALGGQVDATDLAGGISEALITTAAGLAVAIPAMLFYHFIDGKIDAVLTQIKDSAVHFPVVLGGFSFRGGATRETAPGEAGDPTTAGGASHGV